MGHQHHLPKRKTIQQALTVLTAQMAKHKEIAIRCEPEHFNILIPILHQLHLFPELTYYDKFLVFRWNGTRYEPHQRQYFKNRYESSKTTLNWNYVQTESK